MTKNLVIKMTMHDDISGAMISVEQNKESGDITAKFCYSNEREVFSGHFPGMPIVPGIMQLEMVRFCVAAIMEKKYQIAGIKKAKFIFPIKPGDMIYINLTMNHKTNHIQIRAQLDIDGNTAAKIILKLEETT